MRKPVPAACPCGSGHALENCCGRYLHGAIPAPDAEALMRSRYTAYALREEAYLLATWHASTRPVRLDLEQEAQAPQWIGLKVKSHQVQDAHHASVDFVARYRVNGRAHKLEELSRFLKEDGRWYYVSAAT
ncbi:MAG TPA: YchJ family metal-binding protein [Burkholderiales bacterium]|jgi:SEC-C motif-containing protein